MKKNIAIFVSGNGTNFEKIVDYLRKCNRSFNCFLFCNNKNSRALKISDKLNIKNIVFNKEELKNDMVFSVLKKHKIDFIVLSGFLLLVPEKIISFYKEKIINIHPALLPDFGGRGMFGLNVHEAVINSKNTKSGITIHYVNKHYDKGKIIFQKECVVEKKETPSSLEKKIRSLEHYFYPKIIDEILFKKKQIIMYTDGSSLGNPGKGGLGVVLLYGKHRKEISEGYRLTTNNRMELLAVIKGLENLKNKNSNVTVYSDSTYVVKAVNDGWVFNWEKNNFKKKKNSDLWMVFLKLYRKHKLNFVWIKGHANITENERCDFLAVQAAEKEVLLVDSMYEKENPSSLF